MLFKKNKTPAGPAASDRFNSSSTGTFSKKERQPGEPLIRLRGLTKAYETVHGEFLALKNVDLDVQAGEFLAIVGKSGAGKTTLINMLTGVDRATAGEVWVDGVAVHDLDENNLALWRGRQLGIIYQSFYLMPTLSLISNVLLPMDFCGLYEGRRSNERALDLLRQVELEDHAFKLPSAISGGQQQRVAIARALINDPDIIVADEPTGRLDSVTAELIFGIFQTLVARGKTIVMVTHDMSLARRVSRTIQIADGEIVSGEDAGSGETAVPSHALEHVTPHSNGRAHAQPRPVIENAG